MNNEKINQVINDVINDFGLPCKSEINSNSNLREDLLFDSLALASLTVHIEEEFGIDIFEKMNVQTVGEIYQMVEDIKN